MSTEAAAPKPPHDAAMLDAIARELMRGAQEDFDALTAEQRVEEHKHLLWWIEACHAAGYALVPRAPESGAAALLEQPTEAMKAGMQQVKAAPVESAPGTAA